MNAALTDSAVVIFPQTHAIVPSVKITNPTPLHSGAALTALSVVFISSVVFPRLTIDHLYITALLKTHPKYCFYELQAR